MLKKIISALILATLPSAALAQDNDWHPMIETDPSVWALKGYSLLLGAHIPSTRWTLRFASLSMDMPEAMVASDPANQGWTGRIESGFALDARYYLQEGRGGWFTGPIGMVQNNRLTYGGQSVKASNLLLGAEFGYQWFPLAESGLYLVPWIGGAGSISLSGESRAGNKLYQSAKGTPLMGIHLGYEF